MKYQWAENELPIEKPGDLATVCQNLENDGYTVQQVFLIPASGKKPMRGMAVGYREEREKR